MLAETSSLRLWLAACRQAESRPPTVSMRCRVVAASSWTCPRFARWVFVFGCTFCFRRADLSVRTTCCMPTSWTTTPFRLHAMSYNCSKFMDVPMVCSMGRRLSCYISCFRKADLLPVLFAAYRQAGPRPRPVSKTCRSRSKFMKMPPVCSMGLRLSCYISCFHKADLFACTASCMPTTWIMTPYRRCEISYN